MEHAPSPSEDFSERYWRCLYEFKRRRFSFALRRLCEAILDMSIGQGFPDVEVPSLAWLAEANFTTANNLHPLIRALTEANVLGRDDRLKTWWINDIGLWKRLGSDDDITDPGRSARADAAVQRILRHNRLRSNQSELFPLPQTDAELAADGHQARAADWSATGLPPAVGSPPPLADIDPPEDSLKNRLQSLKNRVEESKKKTASPPEHSGTRPCAGPGNQENTNQDIHGKPGGMVATSAPPVQLDYRGWSIYRDLEKFCCEGGDPPFIAKHVFQWQWRIKVQPFWVEMCLRETMAHVREGRRPFIRSRASWIKHLYAKEEQRVSAPVGPAADTELGRKARAELEKHLGLVGKGGAS